MKFWRKQNLLSILLILMLFGGNSSLNDTAKASPGGCRDSTVCFDGSLTPCIPLPTTMPPVDSEYTGGYGFIFRSSNCGRRNATGSLPVAAVRAWERAFAVIPQLPALVAVKTKKARK